MKAKQSVVGFTLIELLTVIAILAVLMSLLFPTLASVRNHTRRLAAQDNLKQIVTAMSAFYTDYGAYPVPPGTAASGTGAGASYTYGDTAASGAQKSNNYLFDVLRAFQGSSETSSIVLAENPRLNSYLQLQYVKDASNPKSGIAPQPAGSIPQYSYVDPWGQPYNVRIDLSYSNQVYYNPPYKNSSLSVPYLNIPVIAWSYGPDQQLGAAGNGDMSAGKFDDVLSWQ